MEHFENTIIEKVFRLKKGGKALKAGIVLATENLIHHHRQNEKRFKQKTIQNQRKSRIFTKAKRSTKQLTRIFLDIFKA